MTIYSLEGFSSRLTERLKMLEPSLKDYNFRIDTIVKQNQPTYTGLICEQKDHNPGKYPILDLDEMYEAYCEGTSIQEIAEYSLKLIHRVDKETPDKYEFLLDYEQCKGMLYVQLMAKDNVMGEVPYQMLDDLAVVCYVHIDLGPDRYGRTAVNDSLIKLWGVSPKEVFDQAFKNSPKIDPAVAVPMADILPSGVPDELGMVILSNRQTRCGCGVICQQGFLDKVDKEFFDGKGMILIPESVDSFLALPLDIDIESEAIKAIIDHCNRGLDPSQVLSNHLYTYSKDLGFQSLENSGLDGFSR